MRRALTALAVILVAGCGGKVATGSGDAHGATLQRYTIHSRYAHHALSQILATPGGDGAGRPLLVFLHGKSSGYDGNESNVNGDFLAALARLGPRAPDVVFPSGGPDSYWHARRGGDWGAYVLREVIPEAIHRAHADGRRVAIGGISMGGFGAYDVARRDPGRFCAVGGHSAAMWFRGADTAPGAFDDAEDFARNDLIATAQLHGRTAWGHARLWLDGGTADPFRAADDALAKALGITVHHWPGGHDGTYWHAHYGSYLRFYAGALAAC